MDSTELSGMIFIVPVQIFSFLLPLLKFFIFFSQLNSIYSPFEMIQERTFGEIHVF